MNRLQLNEINGLVFLIVFPVPDHISHFMAYSTGLQGTSDLLLTAQLFVERYLIHKNAFSPLGLAEFCARRAICPVQRGPDTPTQCSTSL